MPDRRLRLYHIAEIADYEKRTSEEYKPSAFEAEGFVHLSTASQIPGVYQRYYAGRDDLLLLSIEAEESDPRLVFEDLTGTGEKFPHYYGGIFREKIKGVHPVNPEGEHPDAIKAYFEARLSDPYL